MPQHPSFRIVLALLTLVFATSTYAQPAGGKENRGDPASRPTRAQAVRERAIAGGPAARPTRAPTARERTIGKLPRYLNGLAGTALASEQPTPDARDYSPKDQAHAGSDLTISGQGFNSLFIEVRIGEQKLAIKSCTATKVVATLPDYAIGDLVISHGAIENRLALAENYKVTGDARIDSVEPAEFTNGQTVTVHGVNFQSIIQGTAILIPLSEAEAGQLGVPSGFNHDVNTRLLQIGDTVMRITSITHSDTEMTFKVIDVSGGNRPAQVRGKLKLTSGATNVDATFNITEFNLPSPQDVTWRYDATLASAPVTFTEQPHGEWIYPADPNDPNGKGRRLSEATNFVMMEPRNAPEGIASLGPQYGLVGAKATGGRGPGYFLWNIGDVKLQEQAFGADPAHSNLLSAKLDGDSTTNYVNIVVEDSPGKPKKPIPGVLDARKAQKVERGDRNQLAGVLKSLSSDVHARSARKLVVVQPLTVSFTSFDQDPVMKIKPDRIFEIRGLHLKCDPDAENLEFQFVYGDGLAQSVIDRMKNELKFELVEYSDQKIRFKFNNTAGDTPADMQTFWKEYPFNMKLEAVYKGGLHRKTLWSKSAQIDFEF